MKSTISIFAITLLLTACGRNDNKAVTVDEKEAIKVTTAVVKSSDSLNVLAYSGTIEAFQTIPVSFQTAGTVESVLLDEGMPVRKGQLLATLDTKDLMNMFKLTEAQYNQALDAYNRLKTVHQNGSLTEIKWVEMESNLKQAESSMNIAKNNLDKAQLRAPESGFIGKRNIEPGMSSISITSPFEIVKIDRIYVRLSVPENEISKIKEGMKATFEVPALEKGTFMGEVSIVGVVSDRFSRTYEVKVLANNPDNTIKPGMICDLTLVETKNSANVVDYRAVSHDDAGTYVYKVDASRTSVTKQPVKTGNVSKEGIEIISGLQTGDEVVCEGINKISNNSKIVL